ncbi:MAG TPA: YciI family protein [Acidimicrobiales bacterium]|nr:YciI family protein [Acidimicrobiales bacterium]
MRYMLLQNYGGVESDCEPMTEWTPGEVKAHIEFQQVMNQELIERGELVDAQGLAGPEAARFVVSDGAGAPVITDGPFPEAKELLAGYRLVDVDTVERAIEIAAQASAAPGQKGLPIRQRIEVREVLSAPDPEV